MNKKVCFTTGHNTSSLCTKKYVHNQTKLIISNVPVWALASLDAMASKAFNKIQPGSVMNLEFSNLVKLCL